MILHYSNLPKHINLHSVGSVINFKTLMMSNLMDIDAR